MNIFILFIAIAFGISHAKHSANSKITFKSYDKSFHKLIDSNQEPIIAYEGGEWLEGVQALPNGNVVFSDVKSNVLLLLKIDWENQEPKIKTSIWLKPSHFQNGHALDTKCNLIAASHGKRAIEKLNLTTLKQIKSPKPLKEEQWKVLLDSYQGMKFNSPNDLIVDSSGDIWFSDPRFGLLNPLEGYGGKQEIDGEFVYRYSPNSNDIIRLNTPLLKTPNGLALSPDEKILYIADSQLAYDINNKSLQHRILAYDIAKDKTLKNERILAVIEPGFPDGIKVDSMGNIWSSSANGIKVFNASGKLLGEIIFPQVVGNFAFSLNDLELLNINRQFQRDAKSHQAKYSNIESNIKSSKQIKSLLYVASLSKLYILKLNVQSGIKR
ncbi:SMP-30/gluconolactonase/LRE family protein [Helicobacter muridarum]|uniref:Gluconolactonase n=1 Tax=Helicobacter muridarum TaxID=216 RepID=A0A377PST2_9HELI|nr:SMP-30/gluconolactonase/LRE family protein [Helicobacter muridarum]TLE00649.1 SMP-30/gluconolactonase/LRE family protein [Helicobacter muridarum]STQ85667.1 gluconolactonase [Helicobacter muridarum]